MESIPYANALDRVSGQWPCGKAGLYVARPTSDGWYQLEPAGSGRGVVIVGYPLAPGLAYPCTYDLNLKAPAASTALMRIQPRGNGIEPAVTAFVSRYGCLYLPSGIALLMNKREVDHWSYLHWCEQTGRPDDAAYFRWWTGRLLERQFSGKPLATVWKTFGEPVSLYLWASESLRRLRDQLVGGGLDEKMADWFESQLAHLRVRPSQGQPGSLTIVARSLMASMVMHTALTFTNEQPQQRACGVCYQLFPVSRRDQRYCSATCKQKAKKRRQRARAPM